MKVAEGVGADAGCAAGRSAPPNWKGWAVDVGCVAPGRKSKPPVVPNVDGALFWPKVIGPALPKAVFVAPNGGGSAFGC